MTHTLYRTQFSEPSQQAKPEGAGSIPFTHNSPRRASVHNDELWTEEASLLDVLGKNWFDPGSDRLHRVKLLAAYGWRHHE